MWIFIDYKKKKGTKRLMQCIFKMYIILYSSVTSGKKVKGKDSNYDDEEDSPSEAQETF